MVQPVSRDGRFHPPDGDSDGLGFPYAPGNAPDSGVDAFIRGTSHLAWLAYVEHRDASWFVRAIGEQYAFIRLDDISHPRRFLGQMAGAPPVQFGTNEFRSSLVDDYNPARHYMAFVFVGFYLPVCVATLILIFWEIAGFIRYRGEWSWPDIRSGRLGIRHGKLVRQYGPVVLPGLIAAQLADR